MDATKADTEIAVNNLNYRGIMILSVLVSDKIPKRILLEKTNAAVDLKLRDQQVGFRLNTICSDVIGSLCIINEQSL